jgi:hypothetical protein
MSSRSIKYFGSGQNLRTKTLQHLHNSETSARERERHNQSPAIMTTAKTVKDVSPHEFVKAYSAHLKRSGKVISFSINTFYFLIFTVYHSFYYSIHLFHDFILFFICLDLCSFYVFNDLFCYCVWLRLCLLNLGVVSCFFFKL